MPSFLSLLYWPVAAAITAAQSLDSPSVGTNPEVQLDYGTFRGNTDFLGVDSFLGIPFAKAGRFENPTVYSAADKLVGVQDATQYGLACPQVETTATQAPGESSQIKNILVAIEQVAFPPISRQGEDCLSINVQVPSNLSLTTMANLPVIMWIHGGGFEFGSSAALASESTVAPGVVFQGAHIVQRSIAMGQPIIFVSANYRLNGFGTLASQEITNANVSNLMLKDQRTAMRWVQNYIGNFGGDKSKVTIFGESAGSWSVATHMVLNNGDNEGLFRAAIMASGGILKSKDYHASQATFDYVRSFLIFQH